MNAASAPAVWRSIEVEGVVELASPVERAVGVVNRGR